MFEMLPVVLEHLEAEELFFKLGETEKERVPTGSATWIHLFALAA